MWRFRTRCPLELEEQAWIEHSLRMLIERIGVDRVLAAQLVTADSFPPQSSDDPVEQTIRHFCSLLEIDRCAFELKVVPFDRIEVLGLWKKDPPTILISDKAAATEAGLLSVAAHELMHEYLLRRQLLTGQEADHEQLTDLAMAILGLGIPHANSALNFESSHSGIVGFWTMQKNGYLSAMQMGYAMAVIAHFRSEDPAPYRQNLRGDARHTFVKGMKYLSTRSGHIVALDAHRRLNWPTPEQLKLDLEGDDACRQLCALRDLHLQPVDTTLLPSIVPLLDSRQPAIRELAIRILAKANHDRLEERLLHLLTDSAVPVRIASCDASAPYLSESQDLSRLVFELLNDRSPAVVNAAVAALDRSRTRHRIVVEPIVKLLKEAVRRRPEIEIRPLLHLLTLHCDDPAEELRDSLFAETDQDELAELLVQLGNLKSEGNQPGVVANTGDSNG